MPRRLVAGGGLAVVLAAAFLTGSGVGASAVGVRGAQRIPARLAAAIRARVGAGALRSSSAASSGWNPYFGQTVALSADGTTALVGAYGASGGKGVAYIFHVSGAGSWSSSATPTATLTSGSPKHQGFGLNVALSADGTTAFVGAPGAVTGGPRSGAVYVFHVSAEGAWPTSSTPAATLSVNHKDLLGSGPLAVSTDGATLVAGVPFRSNLAGGGLVFHASSEGAWASTSTPTATLTDATQDPSTILVGGDAVAISGDGATVLLSDVDDPNRNGTYLYHVASAAAWTAISTPTAMLADSDVYTADGYGLALSGDGTVAFVAAPGNPNIQGVVNVFRVADAAAWATTSTPTATLTDGAGKLTETFGVGVAVSTDGTTALVTAPGIPGYSRARGRAFIFHVADETAWTSTSVPAATLPKAGGRPGDELGATAPALSGDGATALLGAPAARFDTGAADVFHASAENAWTTATSPTAILSNSDLNACVVPDLKGLKLSAAKSQLKARSCRVGKVNRVTAKKRKQRGRVVGQSIKPGSRPPVGTKVSLTVGR